MGPWILLALLAFASAARPASADETSQVYAYPVPYRPSAGDTRVTFAFLPSQGSIQIFSASGEQVSRLDFTDPSDGKLLWNVTNSAGEPLSSGVYIFRVKDPTGSRTGKILVIR